MKENINYTTVINRLKENKISFGELEIGRGLKIVVSERGGRVYGPFLNDESESIFWINEVFSKAGDFKEFINSGEWNTGGERFWLAPEIQFSIKDRNNFWESYHLQESIDPGHYALENLKPNYISLKQEMNVKAYNLASGTKQLRLERLIRPAADPLKYINTGSSITENVIFAGYEQIVELSEITKNRIMGESWMIIQLNPGGTIYIPSTPKIKETNYFEPIDSEYQQINSNYVRLRITGNRRYKVGYKSAHVFGRLAYVNHLKDGKAYILIRNYFNNPSAPYGEEPADIPGCRGHSIHIYNDNGNFGGFGELECHGQPIGGETDKSHTVDQFGLWLYIGDAKAIKEIALHLLGIAIEL